MNRTATWRYILIVLLIGLGVMYAIPNLFGEQYAVQLTRRTSVLNSNTVVKKTQLNNEIKNTLTKPSADFPHGIPFKKIHIPTKEGTDIVSSDTMLTFDSSKAQEAALVALQDHFNNNYSVAMNMVTRAPKWFSLLGMKPLTLGLDLRGGVHFLYKVDTDSLISSKVTNDRYTIVAQLKPEKKLRKIFYNAVLTDKKNQSITVIFKNNKDLEEGKQRLSDLAQDYLISETTKPFPGSKKPLPALSITLREGVVTNLKMQAMTRNISTLEDKINKLGVAEPVIQKQGNNDISIDLPGIQDMSRAKNVIGTIATVEMHLVEPSSDSSLYRKYTAEQACSHSPFTQKVAVADGSPGGQVYACLNPDIALKGESIVDARAGISSQGGPSVSVSASGSDVSKFFQVTTDNVGRPISTLYKTITPDGKSVSKVISIANINDPLQGSFEITFGNHGSMKQAEALAHQLRSGSYAAPLKLVSQEKLGPSMGKKNVESGILSCLIGSAVVILFMALYYQLFGIVANLALLLNVLFVIAVMSILGATMTVPGIAGIILTVGMAVDANVLINERIREELRLGLSSKAAIKAGYERAFATIVDANVTTLLVACILYGLGSGSVKGFAVTLTIGLLTSMFTSIFFTRAIVNLIYGGRKVKALSIGMGAASKQLPADKN